MSHSQFQSEVFILRLAWLNLWDERMTTGRINQVAFSFPKGFISYIPGTIWVKLLFSVSTNNYTTTNVKSYQDAACSPSLSSGRGRIKCDNITWQINASTKPTSMCSLQHLSYSTETMCKVWTAQKLHQCNPLSSKVKTLKASPSTADWDIMVPAPQNSQCLVHTANQHTS